MSYIEDNHDNEAAEVYANRKPAKKKIIKMFYDLETTGTDERKHGIHQISGCIEVDDIIVETFDFKVAPHPKAQIAEGALEVSKNLQLTEEIIRAYPEMGFIHKKLTYMLGKYVDRYKANEKIYLVGFNNRKFDDIFLRKWFEHNKDAFFGSWFWPDSLDALVLASEYLISRRASMPSFKLHRVARELGLVVDNSRLHDAIYDIELTRQIYRIVTLRDAEL